MIWLLEIGQRGIGIAYTQVAFSNLDRAIGEIRKEGFISVHKEMDTSHYFQHPNGLWGQIIPINLIEDEIQGELCLSLDKSQAVRH